LAIWRFQLGRAAYFDMAYYDNVAWNASQGEITRVSYDLYGHRNFHIQLMAYLPALFYSIFPGWIVLLLTQAALLTAGVFLAFRIGQALGGKEEDGWFLTAVYLLTPSLVYWNLFDYHPNVGLVPTLLLGCLGLITGRTGASIAGFGLALLMKEDASLTIGWAGFLVALLWPARRRIGVGMVLASSFWFFFTSFLLAPWISGLAMHPHVRLLFPHLGKTLPEVFWRILTDPIYAISAGFHPRKLAHLIAFFLPSLGTAFLAPEITLVGFPYLGYAWLAAYRPILDVRNQYCTVLVPFLVVATGVGTLRLIRFLERHRPLPEGKSWKPRIRKVFLLLGALWWCLLLSTGIPSWRTLRPRIFVQHLPAIRRLLPEGASLMVQRSLAPHFISRRYVSPYGVADPEVGEFPWILLSLREIQRRPLWPPWKEKPSKVIPAISLGYLADGGRVKAYRIVFEKDGVVLLQRTPNENHPETWARIQLLWIGSSLKASTGLETSSPR
jgi:uncharacterized membrane protein